MPDNMMKEEEKYTFVIQDEENPRFAETYYDPTLDKLWNVKKDHPAVRPYYEVIDQLENYRIESTWFAAHIVLLETVETSKLVPWPDDVPTEEPMKACGIVIPDCMSVRTARTENQLRKMYFTNPVDANLRIQASYAGVGHDLERYKDERWKGPKGKEKRAFEMKRDLVMALLKKVLDNNKLDPDEPLLDEVKRIRDITRGKRAKKFKTFHHKISTLMRFMGRKVMEDLGMIVQIETMVRSFEILKLKYRLKNTGTEKDRSLVNNRLVRLARIRLRLMARIASIYYKLKKLDVVMKSRLGLFIEMVEEKLFQESTYKDEIFKAFGVPMEKFEDIPFQLDYLLSRDIECFNYMTRTRSDEWKMKFGLLSRIDELEPAKIERDELLETLSVFK